MLSRKPRDCLEVLIMKSEEQSQYLTIGLINNMTDKLYYVPLNKVISHKIVNGVVISEVMVWNILETIISKSHQILFFKFDLEEKLVFTFDYRNKPYNLDARVKSSQTIKIVPGLKVETQDKLDGNLTSFSDRIIWSQL